MDNNSRTRIANLLNFRSLDEKKKNERKENKERLKISKEFDLVQEKESLSLKVRSSRAKNVAKEQETS